jgi:16S rRNA (adenine1518-N6/adenine1519-N6)-dimethyltransferase
VPIPKVTSAVVELTPSLYPPFKPDDHERFKRFAHALFAHRRKNVLNNLERIPGLDRDAASSLLASACVDAATRAERLDWHDLERLYKVYAHAIAYAHE